MILLDTNICSYAIRRPTPGLRQRFEAHAPELAISSIVQMELLYGCALRPDATALRARVDGLIGRLAVLPFDQAAAEMAARVLARLRRAGTPIGGYDPLIAAHAMALDALLVTANTKHFAQVEGLRSDNWT